MHFDSIVSVGQLKMFIQALFPLTTEVVDMSPEFSD